MKITAGLFTAVLVVLGYGCGGDSQGDEVLVCEEVRGVTYDQAVELAQDAEENGADVEIVADSEADSIVVVMCGGSYTEISGNSINTGDAAVEHASNLIKRGDVQTLEVR